MNATHTVAEFQNLPAHAALDLGLGYDEVTIDYPGGLATLDGPFQMTVADPGKPHGLTVFDANTTPTALDQLHPDALLTFHN